jgi:hypothetical protein
MAGEREEEWKTEDRRHGYLKLGFGIALVGLTTYRERVEGRRLRLQNLLAGDTRSLESLGTTIASLYFMLAGMNDVASNQAGGAALDEDEEFSREGRARKTIAVGLIGGILAWSYYLNRQFPREGGQFFSGLRQSEDRTPPPLPPQCPEGMVWEDTSGACVPIMEQHLPWPAGPRTGYSWEEMEEVTPDLKAAKRAAQAAWHGFLMMPGPVQWGYKFGMDMPLPGDR